MNRAAREHILRKDLDFVRVLVRERMVHPAVPQERVTMLPDVGGVRDLVRSRLSRILRRPSSVRLASTSMCLASAAGGCEHHARSQTRPVLVSGRRQLAAL
jgi:hypothetical protein